MSRLEGETIFTGIRNKRVESNQLFYRTESIAVLINNLLLKMHLTQSLIYLKTKQFNKLFVVRILDMLNNKIKLRFKPKNILLHLICIIVRKFILHQKNNFSLFFMLNAFFSRKKLKQAIKRSVQFKISIPLRYVKIFVFILILTLYFRSDLALFLNAEQYSKYHSICFGDAI